MTTGPQRVPGPINCWKRRVTFVRRDSPRRRRRPLESGGRLESRLTRPHRSIAHAKIPPAQWTRCLPGPLKSHANPCRGCSRGRSGSQLNIQKCKLSTTNWMEGLLRSVATPATVTCTAYR